MKKRIKTMMEYLFGIRTLRENRHFVKEMSARIDGVQRKLDQATLNGENHWFLTLRRKEGKRC